MFGKRLVVKMINRHIKVMFGKDEPTCFDHDTNTLIVGEREFEEVDEPFFKNILQEHEYGSVYCYSPQLWYLLHEIGHFYTDDNVKETEADMLARMMCAITPIEEVENDQETMNIYFNLPKEWAATEWAIEFIINHPIRAKFFSKLAKM